MIVLDASVLIAHFESSDALHGRAAVLLTGIAEHMFAASPITLAELLVGPARARRLDQAMAALQRLAIATVPLGDDAAPRLAALRVATGLKLPDCCVLLAAEQTDGEVATFDERLAAAAADRGLTVHS